MQNIILIRFGEIFLKGENRAYFEKMLFRNMQNSLQDFSGHLSKIQGRYLFSDYEPEKEGSIVVQLTKVFGIHSISRALKVANDINVISEAALTLVTGKNFRVSTNRADKKFAMSSMEVSSHVGGFILTHRPMLTVDLHHPDCDVQIDIREDGYTYLFSQIIACERGMPYGCGGKGILLLSGGIDSPVAGYQMAKRGMLISGLHFHSYPFTSEQAKEKVITLSKILKGYCGNSFKLNIVPFTEIQQKIHENCHESYMITIMRRFMMRIAERVADMEHAQAIITGESLGQVASQTVESIAVTNAVVSKPVLRPLIGTDKIDIVNIATKIGSYETSILPYEDCCTVFLPKNPVIKPKLTLIEEAEQNLEIDALVEQALSRIESVLV